MSAEVDIEDAPDLDGNDVKMNHKSVTFVEEIVDDNVVFDEMYAPDVSVLFSHVAIEDDEQDAASENDVAVVVYSEDFESKELCSALRNVKLKKYFDEVRMVFESVDSNSIDETTEHEPHDDGKFDVLLC